MTLGRPINVSFGCGTSDHIHKLLILGWMRGNKGEVSAAWASNLGERLEDLMGKDGDRDSLVLNPSIRSNCKLHECRHRSASAVGTGTAASAREGSSLIKQSLPGAKQTQWEKLTMHPREPTLRASLPNKPHTGSVYHLQTCHVCREEHTGFNVLRFSRLLKA